MGKDDLMQLPVVSPVKPMLAKSVPQAREGDRLFAPPCRWFRRASASACALFLAAACAGSSSTPSATRPTSAGPTSASSTSAAPVGATGDLPARWWQWTESVDPASNPIDDKTGASCATNQPSDIWFLAGTHGGKATRSCTVTSGRAVYFPVINQVCTVTAGQSDAAAAAACKASADVATASLDGAPLTVTEAESRGSFQLVSRPGSTTLEPGSHKVVAWGLWVGPVELSPGRHTVTLLGKAGSFETEVTYTLTAR
jgi:hypothetical protein